MEITRISETKKGRFALYIDGAFLLSLHEEVFLSAHLQKGQQVTVERLEELRRLSELRIARDRALRMLSARSYTAGQMQERLERYADPDIAAQVVARMEELGLIDDAAYARAAAKDLYHLKMYAPSRILQELRRRGIPEWVAEEAVESIALEDTDQRLLDWVERRYGTALRERGSRQKAVNALLRLGYSREEAQTAVRRGLENLPALDGEEGEAPWKEPLALVQQKYLGDLSTPKGRQKVLGALLRKGWAYGDCKEAIAQAAALLPQPEEDDLPLPPPMPEKTVEEAVELLQRKYQKDLSTPKGRQKVLSALLRKGWEYGDCKEAIAQAEALLPQQEQECSCGAEEAPCPEPYSLLAGKYRKGLATAKGRQRAMNGLLRLGCDRQEIQEAMAQVMVEWDIPFGE